MNKLLYYFWYPIPNKLINSYLISIIIFLSVLMIFLLILNSTVTSIGVSVGLFLLDYINIGKLKEAGIYENPF